MHSDLAKMIREDANALGEKYGGEKWKQAKEEAEKQKASLSLLHDIPFKVTYRGQKRLFARLLEMGG